MSRRPGTGTWTMLLSISLAAAAGALCVIPVQEPLLVGYGPSWLLACLLAATFVCAELFLTNVEFRRQAHSFTLAGVPLLLGVLLLSPITFVVVRVAGSLAAMVWQRVAWQKVLYNLCAYAFEAALDAVLLHLLFDQAPALRAWSALAVIGVLAGVDQLLCLCVMILIRLHNGPLSRSDVLGVQSPALVLSVIASSFAFAVLILTEQGEFGLGVAGVLGVVGVLGHRGYAKMQRRHESLSLVHDFVTGGVGAESTETLARELLARIRRLLRAGRVEVVVREAHDTLDGLGQPALVLSVDDQDRLCVTRNVVDPSDWVALRVLTSDEPILIARSTRDAALKAWLSQRGMRDAMVVPLPSLSGEGGMMTAGDRLGETATFTTDDLTLLQTLAGHLAVALRSTRLVEKLAYDATHDSLTGLANRAHLTDQINAVIADPLAEAAVLLLDLDRFKEVNDALGHDIGDRLLCVVAERLRDCAPDGATIARIGGDEFAVLLPDTSLSAVETLAHHIGERLARAVAFDEAMLAPQASIGVATTNPASRQTELLRQADTAMYEAKTNDSRFAVYDAEMDRGRVERLALLADLRNALVDHPEEFMLHYQPKICLDTGAVIGAEALVRWNHPTLGTIAPDRFIQLAETTGLVADLTRLVLASALEECARWADLGLDLTVAVNLSARNVGDRELPERVAAALRLAGVPANRLTLEITESSVMGDPEQALPILQQLDTLGVCLSLDDFGTGYSSLSYLQRLPVGEVKIDRSFVAGLSDENATNSRELIRSIAGLGGNLELRIVAEGIEDAGTLAELKGLGCHVGQGYFISRPLPGPEFVRWLTASTHLRSTALTLVGTTYAAREIG